MVTDYTQHNGVCINELFIHGLKKDVDNFINNFPRSDSYNLQIVYVKETESNIILIADSPEIKLFENLSGEYHLSLSNTFYNSEADYAGNALIMHGNSKVEVETYYKGLYYFYPARFWEEIDNLIEMMRITGGDWEEIEKEIDFCQEEDYNTVKDMFKGVVRITDQK